MINKKGFTLIELLVVIAIIALLLSILLPSLGMAKELARRVTCSTNLKSIGVGLHMYSKDYNEKTIPNARYTGKELFEGITSGYNPWEAYIAGNDLGDPDFLVPVQLGKLFSLGYLEVPEIFYCASAQVSLEDNKDVRYYTENLDRYMPPGQGSGWGAPIESTGKARCRSSYIYWTWTETSLINLSNKPVVIDSMISIAHKKRGKPYGVNALFGDGHASTTSIANKPGILNYVNQATWNDRAHDYDGFVKALMLLSP